MGEVIREQLQANPANAPVLDQALSAIDALEAGKRIDVTHMHPGLLPLFRPEVQGFLISAFSYDPRRLLAGYPKPVLIVQGKRDMQVHESDANLLKLADPQSTVVLIPDMNHVLKTVKSDERRENIATYSNPGLPLSPGVVSSIVDFLNANLKVTSANH